MGFTHAPIWNTSVQQWSNLFRNRINLLRNWINVLRHWINLLRTWTKFNHFASKFNVEVIDNPIFSSFFWNKNVNGHGVSVSTEFDQMEFTLAPRWSNLIQNWSNLLRHRINLVQMWIDLLRNCIILNNFASNMTQIDIASKNDSIFFTILTFRYKVWPFSTCWRVHGHVSKTGRGWTHRHSHHVLLNSTWLASRFPAVARGGEGAWVEIQL